MNIAKVCYSIVMCVSAHLFQLPASTANTLTFSYLGSRVLFNLLYIFVESDSVANLRSVVYLGGIGLVCTSYPCHASLLY